MRLRYTITALLTTLVCALVMLAAVYPARAADEPTPSPTIAATETTPDTPEPATPIVTATPAPTLEPSTPTPSAAVVQPQQASGLRLEITKTLEGSDLVQVGEYLTFTIRIRNSGAITITTLPLIDEYDPAVLQPALARFAPAPDSSSSGRLDWSDLTDLPGFGDLAPGQEFTVLTVFRAVGISDEVINRARVEAAVGSGGQGGGPTEGSAGGTVEGGSASVEKALVVQPIRADTPVIVFTITIRNDGAADLVSVPVEDQFSTAHLSFISASVPPDSYDPATGLLRWNNVLAGLGMARLRPAEVVTVTTTFQVLAPIDDLVVNRVIGTDVRDEFGNAVQAPRQADVRIRIRAGQATPTPGESRRERTPTPTEVVLTPTATLVDVTPVVEAGAAGAAGEGTAGAGAAGQQGGQSGVPATLPATGADDGAFGLVWLALAAGGLALALRRRRQ